MWRNSSKVSKFRRKLAVTTMDKLSTSMYKATVQDGRPPKEKHLRALVDFAGMPATCARLGAELARRLSACRSARHTETAAKALCVVHRIILAGHGGVLGEARPFLKALGTSSATETRTLEGEYVAEFAIYLDALCGWGEAGSLRSREAMRSWGGRTSHSLLRELPRLQILLSTALQASERLPVASPSLALLRLGIIEDAFDLFRCEAAAVAALSASMLALPLAAVTAQPAGALSLLEVYSLHTRRTHSLQRSLRGETAGAFCAEGTRRVLAESLPWADKGRAAAADAPAAAGDAGGDAGGGGGGGAGGGVGVGEGSLVVSGGIQGTGGPAEDLPRIRLLALAAERAALMRFALSLLPTDSCMQVCAQLELPTDAPLTDTALLAIQASHLMHAIQRARPTEPEDAEGTMLTLRGDGKVATISGMPTISDMPRLNLAAIHHTVEEGSEPDSRGGTPPALTSAAQEGSLSTVEDEDTVVLRRSQAAILAALPVAAPVLHPPFPFEIDDFEIRIAAYEMLLLALLPMSSSGTEGFGSATKGAGAHTQALSQGHIHSNTHTHATRSASPLVAAARHGGSFGGKGGLNKLLASSSAKERSSLGQRMPTPNRASGPSIVNSRAVRSLPPPSGSERTRAAMGVCTGVPGRHSAVGAVSGGGGGGGARASGCGGAAPSSCSSGGGGEWGGERGCGSGSGYGNGVGNHLVGASDEASLNLNSEVAQTIRTRLGISLKQHRRSCRYLYASLAESEVRASSFTRASPAHLALLLIYACTVDNSHTTDDDDITKAAASPTTATTTDAATADDGAAAAATAAAAASTEAAAFCRRQLLMLSNALELRGVPAEAIHRIEAQVERLLRRRLEHAQRQDCEMPLSPDSKTAATVAAGECQDDIAALRGTLIEVGVLGGDGGGGGGDSHWPFVIAFRLYCELLSSIFDPDEPGAISHDRSRLLSAFRRLTDGGPLHLDERQQQLALLTVCMERYHHESAAPLLPVMISATQGLISPDEMSDLADGDAGNVRSAWQDFRQRRNEILAGIAANIAGRLRDYRAHFPVDVDEMAGCVQLWRTAVLHLQPGGASVNFMESTDSVTLKLMRAMPEADANAHAEAHAQELLRVQARALVAASVSRNMRRVRLRIDNTNEVNGRLGTIALEDTSTSAAVASERLVALTEALREEFEAEMHFAQCFDACLLSGDEIEQPPAAASTVHATRAAAVAANSRKSVPLACRDASVGRGSAVSATASQLAPGGGYDAALEAFAREMHADISAVRANFNTVEAHGLRAVKALASIAQILRSRLGEAALPEVEELAQQMANGWFMRLPGELSASLDQTFRLERWVQISDAAKRTSSVVDVFTQLDQITQVYADLVKDLQLPPSTHEAFLDILQTQVKAYVSKLRSSCAELPLSVLQTGVDWHGAVGSKLAHAPAAAPRRQKPLSRKKGNKTDPTAIAATPRQHALDEQTLTQLCLRLNNVVWAGEQLRVLRNKLRAAISAIRELPELDTSWVEQACLNLIDYIAAKQVYYELEEHLLLKLYVPSASEPSARLASLLETGLNPMLRLMVSIVSPKLLQDLVMGMLGTVNHALGSVLEMPRGFREEHRQILREDLRQLCAFFQDGGILDQQLVISSMSPLYALVDEACEG